MNTADAKALPQPVNTAGDMSKWVAGVEGDEGGLTPAVGVTRMMQQCTQILKDKMWASLSPQLQQ